jgi:AcrR family transcriptional regulator
VPRPKQRTSELRDQVLRVALGMLADDGVTGFTTRAVAQGAATSVPAVYELFGDKAGLVREIFFEGFRMLRRRFDEVADTGDPRADLVALIGVFRSFVRANPVLAQVMYSRPFADFDPGPAELAATGGVRELIVAHVRRCTDAGVLQGNPTDIAHILLALAQGLAAQETAGWLGSSPASVDRRWAVALRAALDGFHRPSADRAFGLSGADRALAPPTADRALAPSGSAIVGLPYVSDDQSETHTP